MPALQPDQGAAFQPDLPGEAQDHWLVPETSLAEVPQLPMPSVQPHSAPPPAAPPPPVPAAPHPVQPAEAYAPAPDVIGRYNAGGAAYVMYSDGSIDAETQTGTFRFASMKELRQFIEHRTVPAGTGS